MPIDFESVIARQTVADIKSSMVSACEAVSFRVLSLPGLSRLRKLALDAVPAIVELGTRINAEAIRGGLLDYASGIWLELLAINLFGLEGRIGYTFATTTITFANTGSGEWHLAAGETTVSNGIVTYKTTGRLDLAPTGNPGATAQVGVISSVIGSAGDSLAGEIDTMVTQFDGVTCTNVAAARGSDRESDEQLRERCRLARSALSNSGPVDAIKLVALSARREDGSAIGINRVQVVEHVPNMGDVTTYLADADGAPETEDVERIDYLLRTLVIPTGINYLGTFGATEVVVPVTYTAKARTADDFTEAELEASAAADLAAMFADPASNPIGGFIDEGDTNGWIYRSELVSVISQTQPAEGAPRPLKNVAVAAPATDVELEPGEVAVLGTITPTITFVSG